MQDTNNGGEESLGCFLDLMLNVLTYASIFLVGLYAMLAWGWVIAPVFHVAKLSYWSATGVYLVIQFFTQHSATDLNFKKSRATRWGELGIDILGDTFFLILIWIVSLGI
ncbi:hypothetical protein IWT140_01722 [Secundilactobacillus pentosiphilus]|uniref:Uncharacterized protein n=1 Tax=Secundilactobacillus pentosiphilus TaxID=1714682 RepID=A0A1Z5IQN8_9LACO|nr:hypothetical protein [Secundilactobacillus pentosiphilus]GAX04085.1 hypothetical protein IWT140_01722 [Secundilactobacillus pentosiphilus]